MPLDVPGGTDHPSWRTAVGTFVGYAIVITVLAALLFGLPYLAISAL